MRAVKASAILLAVTIIALTVDYYRGRTITYRWNYDYSKYSPCPPDLGDKRPQKPCLYGFNVFLEGKGGRTNQQFVPNRFDGNGRIIAQDLSVVVRLRQYGKIQFCVTSLARDDRGLTAESLPTCIRGRLLPFGLGRR